MTTDLDHMKLENRKCLAHQYNMDLLRITSPESNKSSDRPTAVGENPFAFEVKPYSLSRSIVFFSLNFPKIYGQLVKLE